MPWHQRIYVVLYGSIAVLFGICAVGLIAIAVFDLVPAFDPTRDADSRTRFDEILEAIGMLTIAVAALELSQTVLEEEILRRAHLSSPTRARRFLSRFLIVVVVSASIEFLIAVFQLVHHDASQLPAAATIGFAAAALLLAWGAFVRWNRAAEQLEPEALAEVKAEDDKVK